MRNKRRNDCFVTSKIERIIGSVPTYPYPYMSYTNVTDEVNTNDFSEQNKKDLYNI